jgi:hypothetical protein
LIYILYRNINENSNTSISLYVQKHEKLFTRKLTLRCPALSTLRVCCGLNDGVFFKVYVETQSSGCVEFRTLGEMIKPQGLLSYEWISAL